MAQDPERVGCAILLFSVGFAMLVLATFSIRLHVRAAGEERYSFYAVPLITVGAVLLMTCLGAEGLGSIGANEAGADGTAYLEEVRDWTLPTQMVAGLLLLLGMIALAASIVRSRVLSENTGRIVAAALVIGATANLLPWGWALYAGSIALLIALLPVASTMWGKGTEGMMEPKPSPA